MSGRSDIHQIPEIEKSVHDKSERPYARRLNFFLLWLLFFVALQILMLKPGDGLGAGIFTTIVSAVIAFCTTIGLYWRFTKGKTRSDD